MSYPGVEPVSSNAPQMTGPVLMNQSWRDVTFLQWAVDPQPVANRMPPRVRPDTFDGVTYVGLIPFRMVGAGLGPGPAVPWLGSFLETNVRLYSVDDTGRRGIVFLSLDADRAAVVAGTRGVRIALPLGADAPPGHRRRALLSGAPAPSREMPGERRRGPRRSQTPEH